MKGDDRRFQAETGQEEPAANGDQVFGIQGFQAVGDNIEFQTACRAENQDDAQQYESRSHDRKHQVFE